MRKPRFFAFLLTVCLSVGCLAAPLTAQAAYELPEDTALSAGSALVVYMDSTASGQEAVNSGADTILFEKNADASFAPAALCRIMVGITAVRIIREQGMDTQTATGTYTQALQENYVWGTGLVTANMETGEEWTVADLLALSMIQTAADAAVTLASTLGGSVQLFLDRMNSIAAELGCAGTHFSNVIGLDESNQYTTARDMYIMLRCALDYPELETMLSRTEYTVTPVAGGSERSWATTNNMMRSTSDEYYSPMTLGKTAYSDDSGRSLVSVAESDGYRYMAVVCGCGTESDTAHYDDTRTLYRWAFNNFTYKTLLTKGQPVTRVNLSLAWSTDSLTLVAADSLSCLVINDLDESSVITRVICYQDEVEAPVEKGTVIGRAELYIKTDQKIGEVDLVASESVPRSELLFVWAHVRAFLTSRWFWLAIGLIVLLVVAYLILLYRYNHRDPRDSHRNKRKKKYKSLK